MMQRMRASLRANLARQGGAQSGETVACSSCEQPAAGLGAGKELCCARTRVSAIGSRRVHWTLVSGDTVAVVGEGNMMHTDASVDTVAQ
jgi:hypothetical protein